MNSNNFFSDQSAIHLQKEFLRTSDNFRKAIFYLKADIPLPDKALKVRTTKKALVDEITIKQLFKDLFYEKTTQIEYIDDSTLHSVYQIVLKDEEYILKINNFNDLYHEMQFLQEFWINKVLQKALISFLPIIYIDVSRKKVPFDFIIMKKATGSSLHNLKLNNKEENRIFSKLGESIAKIHNVRTKKFGSLSTTTMIETGKGVGLNTTWEKFFDLKLYEHIAVCLKNKTITVLEKKQIEKLFFINKPLLANIIPCLLHNDLSARNMFVDKNNTTTLVDWEDAISGDPIYDIASFGTFNYHDKHKMRIKHFLEGYQQINKLPVDFERRYWFYYLRIAIVKTALLSRQGKKINKPQMLRIKKAMKVLSQGE